MDPIKFADLNMPQGWNKNIYSLNNPMKYLDPYGRDVIYKDEYSKTLVEYTRNTSHGVNKIISIFESDKNKLLTFSTGDVEDKGGKTWFSATKTFPPKNLNDNPTKFEVILDQRDISFGLIDPRGAIIHEIVGHVGPNSQRSFNESQKMGEQEREKEAQDLTAKEISKIHKVLRPALPPDDMQPEKVCPENDDNKDKDDEK